MTDSKLTSHCARLLRIVLPYALGALAVLSVASAVSLAARDFVDFQIDGSRGLLQGIDVFETQRLSDDSPVRSAINYGHLLYLLLAPFLILSDEVARTLYALLNCILCAASIFLLGKQKACGKRLTFAIIAAVLISTPARVAISNSQTSIIVLFLISVFGLRGGTAGSLGLGMASFKFSFLPVALPLLVTPSRRTFYFGVGLLGPAALAVGLARDVGVFVSPFLRQLGGPRVAYGFGDLATLLRHLGVEGPYAVAVPASVALLYGLVVLRLARAYEAQVVALLIVSLITLPHLVYDYVLLVPLLFKWLEYPDSTSKNLSLGILLLLGFAPTVLRVVEAGASLILGIQWTLFSDTWLGTNAVVLVLLHLLVVLFVRATRRQAMETQRSVSEQRGHRGER